MKKYTLFILAAMLSGIHIQASSPSQSYMQLGYAGLCSVARYAAAGSSWLGSTNMAKRVAYATPMVQPYALPLLTGLAAGAWMSDTFFNGPRNKPQEVAQDDTPFTPVYDQNGWKKLREHSLRTAQNAEITAAGRYWDDHFGSLATLDTVQKSLLRATLLGSSVASIAKYAGYHTASKYSTVASLAGLGFAIGCTALRHYRANDIAQAKNEAYKLQRNYAGRSYQKVALRNVDGQEKTHDELFEAANADAIAAVEKICEPLHEIEKVRESHNEQAKVRYTTALVQEDEQLLNNQLARSSIPFALGKKMLGVPAESQETLQAAADRDLRRAQEAKEAVKKRYDQTLGYNNQKAEQCLSAKKTQRFIEDLSRQLTRVRVVDNRAENSIIPVLNPKRELNDVILELQARRNAQEEGEARARAAEIMRVAENYDDIDYDREYQQYVNFQAAEQEPEEQGILGAVGAWLLPVEEDEEEIQEDYDAQQERMNRELRYNQASNTGKLMITAQEKCSKSLSWLGSWFYNPGFQDLDAPQEPIVNQVQMGEVPVEEAVLPVDAIHAAQDEGAAVVPGDAVVQGDAVV